MACDPTLAVAIGVTVTTMPENDQEYVYAIGHPHGYVKIGRSKDPERRLKHHQTSSPYDLWLIMRLPVANSVDVESKLQNYLSSRHVRGEWYELDYKDYDDLVELMRIGRSRTPIDSIDDLDEHRAKIEVALLG